MAQNIKGYIQAKINLLKKKVDEFENTAQSTYSNAKVLDTRLRDNTRTSFRQSFVPWSSEAQKSNAQFGQQMQQYPNFSQPFEGFTRNNPVMSRMYPTPLAPTPTNTTQRVLRGAGGLTSDIAMTAPLAPAIGAFAPVKALTAPLIRTGTGIVGRQGVGVGGKIVGKGLLNAAQGIPYSLAFQGLRASKGEGISAKGLGSDTAFDVATGALPFVGAGLASTQIDNQIAKSVGKKGTKKLKGIATDGVGALRQDTRSWLETMTKPRGMEELTLTRPTKEIEMELSTYKPKDAVTLYRGLNEAQEVSRPNTGLESWTYDPKMAKDFGEVVSRKISPDEIFLDTTLLPNHLKSKFAGESEVLVKRSDYATDGLEALKNEARKYGSAEEFVRGLEKPSVIEQGKPVIAKVYHGSPDARFADEFNPNQKGYYKDAPDALPDNAEFISLNGGVNQGFKTSNLYDGVFFTDDITTARSYTEKPAFDYQNSVPMTLERYVKIDNPKVVDMKGDTWHGTRGVIEQAKKEGYDGVVIKNVRDVHNNLEGKYKAYNKPATTYIAFDKNQIKTKSQLTDLYTQAKGGVDRTKLTGLQLDATNAKLDKAWGTKTGTLQGEGIAQSALQPQRMDQLSSLETKPIQGLKTTLKQEQSVPQGLKQQSQAISDQISMQRQGVKATIDTAPLKVSPNSSKGIISPAVKDEVQAVQNAVKSKVNALDYFRTPDRVLTKIGLKPEADLLKKQYNSYLDQLPKEIGKVTEWYNRVGKSDEASTRIFKYLDGQPQQLQGEELKVAGEIQSYLADWADKLQLPHDKRILHYITHIFDPDFIQKEFDPDLAKLITDKIPSSVYDPFLQERLGKMGYKENVFEALDAYVKRATRKYNMDPALEQLRNSANNVDLESLKYVTRLGERINLRPTELDNLLDNMVKSSPIGYKLGQRPVAHVSRSLRQAVYRGTLGLNVGSSIRNLTQGVNTYAQLGEKYTGIGYAKALKGIVSRDDELVKSGVLRDQIIQDRTLSATKQFWEKTDRKLFVFFNLAEKINRGAAYFGAKSRALARGASEADAIQEGVDMARKTQFTFGSVDTPVALQSDIVKVFAQFQSFNIKQTEFLSEMVKKKEFAGMARWLGANMVILYAFGKAMGWDWKDMVPFGETIGGERPLGQTPPVKLIGDVSKMAMGGTGEYGQPITAKDIGKDLVPFFPAGTQLKKSIEGLGAYNRGYSQSASGLVRYPVPKTTLNALKTGTLGQYAIPEARNYFDKKLTPLSVKQSEEFKKKLDPSYYNSIMDRRLKNRKQEQPNILEQIKQKLGVSKAQASTDDVEIVTPTSKVVIPKYPKLTGEAELDQALKNKYYSAVGTATKNITKLYEEGQITADEANALFVALKGKQKPKVKKIKAKKAKKAKAITVKKAPAIDMSAPAFTSIKLTAPKFKPTRTSLRAIQPVSEATLQALRSPSLK